MCALVTGVQTCALPISWSLPAVSVVLPGCRQRCRASFVRPPWRAFLRGLVCRLRIHDPLAVAAPGARPDLTIAADASAGDFACNRLLQAGSIVALRLVPLVERRRDRKSTRLHSRH